MKNTLIYKSANMELYSINNQIIKAVFKGFQQPKEAVADEQAMMDAIQSQKVKLLILDERQLKALSGDMKAFLIQSMQKLASSDIKKIAVLTAGNLIARMGMETVVEEMSVRVNYQRKEVTTEQEGIDWLLS